MRGRQELSDAQWKRVERILQPKRRADGRGRPWRDARVVLNGVLWILRTGAQWRELPEKYPPFQTCHRRFQQWVRTGKFEKVLRLLARHLHEMGKLDLREAFVDATFAGAKKGGLPLVQPDGVRGRRSLLSPLTTVFPSRSACKALRRMKASSLKKSLLEAFSKNFQCAWSATGPMTPTHSTEGWKKNTASN
jgi:transposase